MSVARMRFKSLYEHASRRNGGPRELANRERAILSSFMDRARDTRLFELQIPVPNGNRIFAKCEFENPTGSHYDRVYPHLMERALLGGITPEKFQVVECSSGNAAVAFSRVCNALGFQSWVVLPSEQELSRTRVEMAKKEGATVLHPEPAHDGFGIPGAAKKMRRLVHESRKWEKPLWSPNHAEVGETLDAIGAIPKEVIEELEKVDVFVGVAGNGTTLYGIGMPLKHRWPEIRIVAVEPITNPGLFLLKYPDFERIYGEGNIELPKFQPGNGQGPKINMPGSGSYGVTARFPFLLAAAQLVDEIRQVGDNIAEWEQPLPGMKNNVNQAIRESHGIGVGITSLASVMVALELANSMKNKNILVIFYDLMDGRY